MKRWGYGWMDEEMGVWVDGWRDG